jgi:hypothetical protein
MLIGSGNQIRGRADIEHAVFPACQDIHIRDLVIHTRTLNQIPAFAGISSLFLALLSASATDIGDMTLWLIVSIESLARNPCEGGDLVFTDLQLPDIDRNQNHFLYRPFSHQYRTTTPSRFINKSAAVKQFSLLYCSPSSASNVAM